LIEVENHSPFPHFLFEKSGYRGKPFDVLAIKATFRLKTDGTRADLEEQQRPLAMADAYWGEAETSSLKFETDLVIAKQCTNVHVIGHAYAEHNKPCRKWRAGLQIGKLSKHLNVTGPRHWQYQSKQWKLGEPEPVLGVPLRYELAYGGRYFNAEAGSEPVAYQQNPIGIGFMDAKQLQTSQIYPAPQFESTEPGKGIYNIQDRYPPEGFGPLSRWWEPRVKFAGTYDDEWLKTGWPFLPDDFDFAFYNSAPKSLQADGYLQGDEPLVLTGMLPEASIVTTALGGYLPLCVVEDDGNVMHKLFPRLDSITIDTDERLIYQTWRLTLPDDFAARHIVLGAMVPPPENCVDRQQGPLTPNGTGHG